MKKTKKILSILFVFSIVLSLGITAFADSALTITLQIDNPYMTVNGTTKEIDPGIGTMPVIQNSRTLLPVRAVVEEMNGEVAWNGDTREVTLTRGGNKILLTIDNTAAYLNGTANTLDCAPVIMNGRTMLPIRFIAESFGFTVGWDENTRTVTLTEQGTKTETSYSDDVLKTVYNATMLLGNDVPYSENATITYGQLSKAGVTIYMNENETSYAGLDTKYLFEHKYARDFYAAGRDVLKNVEVNAENIDKNVTVGEAIDVLTYYLAKRNDNKVTFDKTALLKGADRNTQITHKQFAILTAELDDIAPILVKIEIAHDGSTKNVPVKIQKDLSKYPKNSGDFRVILEDVPLKMYTGAFEVSASKKDQKPVMTYDFSRDYRDIFLGILSPWVKSANEKAGVEMKMTYYPSLCIDNGNGYTMRVRIDLISVNGDKTLGDIFTASDGSKPNIALKSGTSFFCDLRNNGVIDNVVMPSENLTVSGLMYFK